MAQIPPPAVGAASASFHHVARPKLIPVVRRRHNRGSDTIAIFSIDETTGKLTPAGTYSTGGLGGILTGSVVDHTASQGALAYDQARGLLIAVNPDEDSRLPYLLRVPLASGDLVFRTSGTWPRTKALYCYPVPLDEWPADAVIVEWVGLRSCRRRGAAIDVIIDRARENRSQLVFTTARGRDGVFWQSPRTRKQARPGVRTPTARAAGIPDLQIVIDSHEQYPYRFATQQVSTVKRALPCGDYGLVLDGVLVASVERKSLVDLVASLTGGKLRYQVAELAALPRAALVVEDR